MQGALERIGRYLAKGSENNRDFAADASARDESVSDDMWGLFFDAQTSGGLLISVAREQGEALVAAIRDAGDPAAAAVGEVRELPRDGDGVLVRVE